jgi:polyisoprenyl-phosphate glycosyltransferase
VTAVSVVVPMYRTAATANELHERLSRALATETTVELVYVDDACDRGSSEALLALAAADDRVVALRHDVNRGQHEAIRTGLRATTSDIVIVLDGDLQDPPEAIPTLLVALRASTDDAVFAGRRGAYESRGRLVSGHTFKWVLHRLTGTPRDAGGYVAMTRALVDDIVARDLRHPYLLANIAATGRPTTSLPVARQTRPVGRSATTSRTRVRLAVGTFGAIREARRR